MKVINSTPKKDGFRMPGEFEPQKRIWMIWPERTDNWRDGAKPAQETYANIANTISKFTPVTMCVSHKQFAHARHALNDKIRVVEMSSDDSWMRDCGPTFVKNDKLAISQLKSIFPDKEVIGVNSKEVIYGGGNILCITQQQPE